MSAEENSIVSALKAVVVNEWSIRGLKPISGIIFPLIIGVLVSYATSSTSPNSGVFWFLIIIFVVIQIMFVVLSMVGEQTPAGIALALMKAKDSRVRLQQELKACEEANSSCIAVISCGLFALQVSRNLVQRCSADTQTSPGMKSDLHEILTPYIEFRSQLFCRGTAGRVTLTVFKYEASDETLYVVYKFADIGITSKNRSWKIGRGHAGQCFIRNNVMISNDVAIASELLEEYSDLDREQYRSMASVPIIVNGACQGVLTITCEYPDMFNQDSSQPLFEQMGLALGIYFDGIQARSS